MRSNRIDRRRSRPGVEAMEPRALLAVIVTSYSSNDYYSEGGITTGPDGAIYDTVFPSAFYQYMPTGAIDRVDPATGATVEFQLPTTGAEPTAIVSGPGSKLWFLDAGLDSIGSFDTTTGDFTEYPVKATGSVLTGIAAGPNNTVWFTDSGDGAIGELVPATGKVTEYPLPSATSGPGGIVLGPDGDLWFTEAGGIGRFNPTTLQAQAVVTNVASSTAIVAAPDGRIWTYTYSQGATSAAFVAINPATLAASTYPSLAYVGNPYFLDPLVVAADGNLDFGVYAEIVEVNIKTGAATTVVPAGVGFGPNDPRVHQEYEGGGLVAEPDGSFWYQGFGKYFDPDAYVVHAVPVPANEAIVSGGLIIANSYPGSAGGHVVYADLKGDGTFDLGDPATLTAPDGSWTLTVPAPGSVTFRVVGNTGDRPFLPNSDAQTFTLAGSTLYQFAPLTLRPSPVAILPLTTVAAPFGKANPDVQTAEVTGLYNAILGRAPDAPSLAADVALLKGGTPLATIATALIESAEYDTRLVNSYYLNFLGHVATIAEANAWVLVIQQGNLTPEQVAADFLTSPEYAALHPGNHGLISGIYDEFFGRTASLADLSAWDAAFAAGTTPAEAVTLLITSPIALFLETPGFALAFGLAPGAFDLAPLIAATPPPSLRDVALAVATSQAFVLAANKTLA